MALSATCLWASLDAVKPYLRLALTDVSHDTILEALCNAVTEEIEQATGRIYLTRTVTSEKHTGTGTPRLALDRYPVSAISTLTEDDVSVTSTLYWLESDAGILTKYDGATWSTADVGNVVCTYTAGYARASIPALVQQTALELLRHRYADWSAGADTVSAMTLGGQQYLPRSTWPYQVKDAIDRLRWQYRMEFA